MALPAEYNATEVKLDPCNTKAARESKHVELSTAIDEIEHTLNRLHSLCDHITNNPPEAALAGVDSPDKPALVWVLNSGAERIRAKMNQMNEKISEIESVLF